MQFDEARQQIVPVPVFRAGQPQRPFIKTRDLAAAHMQVAREFTLACHDACVGDVHVCHTLAPAGANGKMRVATAERTA